MSVVRMTASVGEQSTELTPKKGRYKGELVAPEESGMHDVNVYAYDEVGGVTSATKTLEVSLWKTPKTNWTINDRFNFKDYNRIKNNLVFLQEYADILFKPFVKTELGEDITSYRSFYRAESFNQIEAALENLNKNTVNKNFGVSQKFYDNGAFIRYDELNRIERATLEIFGLFERRKSGFRKLPFRFGRFKEVRI